MTKNYNIIQSYQEITATVTMVKEAERELVDNNEIEIIYSVKIKYTVNDKDYNKVIETKQAYTKGDKLTIYYNPENPREITEEKGSMLHIIVIAIGAFIIICGLLKTFFPPEVEKDS